MITLKELLLESLKKVGASGLSYDGTIPKQHEGYLHISDIKKMGGSPTFSLNPESILIWESPIPEDGLRFTTAEEASDYYKSMTDIAPLHIATNEEQYGHKISHKVNGSNKSAVAMEKQCRNLSSKPAGCSGCRLGDRNHGVITTSCYPFWDASPYRMPLDKNIPWPE